MRPTLPVLAAVLAALAAGPAPAAGRYSFALVPKATANPYFELARQGCVEEAARIGAGCLYKGSDEPSPAAQAQVLQDLIAQHVDGLAVSVTDPDTVGPVLRQARAAGIPVVTFDADAPGSGRQATVGTDNHALGLALGTLLKSLRPAGGSYAIVSGSPDAASLSDRVRGVREALKGSTWREAPDSLANCNEDAGLAVQQMGELRLVTTDLGAIVSVGGWPLYAPGPYRAFMDGLKADRQAGRFTVVAADALRVELELVRDGYVDGLVGQRPREMGARAMDLLLALRQGRTVDAVTRVGLDVVTRDTLAPMLK